VAVALRREPVAERAAHVDELDLPLLGQDRVREDRVACGWEEWEAEEGRLGTVAV
jgi:hypothetical protein